MDRNPLPRHATIHQTSFLSAVTEDHLVRLQKAIADQGLASRREAETLITAGAVKVDGQVVTELGTKVDPGTQTIEVDGQVLARREQAKVVIAMWKPVGFVTSTKRTQAEPDIILDLLPKRLQHVYPIGRLDKDSSGLIILTNDGDLAFQLSHPRFGHEKTYHVLLQKPIEAQALEQIRRGDVKILGQTLRPAKVKKLAAARVEVVLREGKNRQIRRTFRALGNGVKKLRRVAIGQLSLDGLQLQEGAWRRLRPQEIRRLLEPAE